MQTMLSRLHSNTTLTTTLVILLFAITGCSDTHSYRSDRPTMELNTNRPGSDISTIALDQAKPVLCHDACQANGECTAWTYVKPGIINTKAHCHIKNSIPEPKRSSCCISGRK
jgi:hypothetical protein